MKKHARLIVIFVFAIFIAIQFFRPDRDNPATDPAQSIWADVSVPADVREILRVSCADCHSNTTTWPWYTHIAPASWLISHDVSEGRGHMNLSLWGSWSEKKRLKRRSDIAEETGQGEMPLGIYTLLHPGAALSSDQVMVLAAWSEAAGTTEHNVSGER